MKKLIALLLAVMLMCSLSLTAFAMDFTPSVETKDTPYLVKIEDSKGDEYDAIFTDEEEQERPFVSTTTLQLVLTPYAKKDDAIVEDITGYLVDAEYQISKADNAGDLTDSMEEALEKARQTSTDPAAKEVTLDDLVVCDLFDVSLVRDEKIVENVKEGETISFCIQTDLTKDDLFFVLLNCSGDEWKVITDLELDENGVLTITLDSLCAIAILVDNMRLKPVDPHGPVSPQTGDASLLIAAAVFAVAAMLFAVRTVIVRWKQAEQ